MRQDYKNDRAIHVVNEQDRTPEQIEHDSQCVYCRLYMPHSEYLHKRGKL